MSNSIELKNVTKKYKTNRGVVNINLSTGEGEIFGLLGPNGAGKTTTLKLITGLLNKQEGSISIGDKEMEKDYESYMKQIGCMIGDVRLYPNLNALQHMVLVTNYYTSITDTRRNEVLDKVGLSQFVNERTRNYSTGMKQRLAFAMSVIHQPKVLLLDEPFSGMDIEGKSMIRTYIKYLAEKEGMSIIVSSHLIHDIEDIATRVAIMDRGEIIKITNKEDALKEHKTLEDYFLTSIKDRRVTA
ncbi:ABC transporter ATP-binding protein [Vallitalea okinawensis]|uniref:ABC transporter ATP-binding protein n=1 Tax=Vallitalea okinawensis TaxID=2078660 RepID=UPI001300A508|nr:ABC transporter ATP-binding protein [Vallitalea okinawensis]